MQNPVESRILFLGDPYRLMDEQKIDGVIFGSLPISFSMVKTKI